MSAELTRQEPGAVRTQTAIEDQCQNTLLSVLAKNKKTIDAVLGQIMDPKRFAYLAVMAIRNTPALAGCSPMSFINSVMLASQMGLEIRRDSAYLIPFGKECQLLIDYKGKLNLARRGGKVGGIQAVTIRENDDFAWGYDINGVNFHHKPDFRKDRGQIVGVYAFAQLVGGGVQFCEPMGLEDIDKIRKRSRAGVASMSLAEIFAAQQIGSDGKQVWQNWAFRDPRRQPWVTDFEAMMQKTALHRLCKALPLDPAGQLSQEVDEGFETGKQPNILADAVDIDPADDKPMIESVEEGDRDGFQQRREQIVAAKTATKTQSDQFTELCRQNESTAYAVMGNAGYSKWQEVPVAERDALLTKIRAELS